jgi:agmatinase
MTTPRTILPDPRRSPRFAGLATFGRYPRLEDVGPQSLPVDWAIYGVPYDTGVTYRPGARFGPRAIRDASQYLKRYSIPHGVDVCAALSLADAGDAPVQPYHPAACLEAVANWASELADPSRTRLLALGGDHSIAYANIEATWRRLGAPAGGLPLIHFDSHLDTVDSVWGERWSHASPFIRAIERGLIDPGRMISIGIKGPLNTPTDLDFARDHGVTIITREDWPTGGAAALAAFKQAIGDTPAYITVDIDVVDPAFAPGTGTPSIGGFSSTELLAILRSLGRSALRADAPSRSALRADAPGRSALRADAPGRSDVQADAPATSTPQAEPGIRVAGADVVEVLPDRDVAGNTALLAAHIVFEILCLDAAPTR